MLVQHPTMLDIWFSARLASCLGCHPVFGLAVQSGIHHNVLGGYWYAFSLVALWAQGTRLGQNEARHRVLTTLCGSTVAILLTILAGVLVSWPPPSCHPALADHYPDYLDLNPNTNSFPSQSTALYTAVSAGLYSRHKLTGALLWVGVALAVALPRMYVGGHYLSDVLAGLVLGLTGYGAARYLLEPKLVRLADRIFEKGGRIWLVAQLVIFGLIFQVATEFRDLVWLKSLLVSLVHQIF